MAKEWILNIATNRWKLNQKRSIGPVSEWIRECDPKTDTDWETFYYLKNAVKPLPLGIIKCVDKYKSNRNVVYSCKYQIVWCPKYRRKVLVEEVEKRLVDPQFGVNKFVKLANRRSSRILKEEFPHLKKKLPTLPTNSYFVATVGETPLEVIKQYIENQQTSEPEKVKKKWNDYLKRLR